jgi:hypothetical protein
MEVFRHEDVPNDFEAQFAPEIVQIPGKVKSEAVRIKNSNTSNSCSPS